VTLRMALQVPHEAPHDCPRTRADPDIVRHMN
jgi:hypothetical protein